MVEALVGIFLLAILSLGIYASYAFGLKMSVQNRMRIEATAIAEKKIEAIRAMDYVNVGIQGGVPSGQLPATETENENGANFTIHTSIRYIDDPLDGKFPSDTVPTDYKQIEVKVNWPTNMEKEIKLDTIASPPRIETNVGMGVLMINTVDSEGNPIPRCRVHIKNSSVSPPIDFSEETDNGGTLALPGVPITSTNSYEITVSLDGYETVQTYPAYPVSSFNPIDTHLSVSQGTITSKVFTIDKLSHQNIQFKDTHGANIPNLTFSLYGGRVIGTTLDAAPKQVYMYNEPALTCSSEGLWQSPEIAKGVYYFSINNPNYELITSSLIIPWSVAPNSTVPVEIIMGSKAENILVVSVREAGGEIPIVGAKVEITDSLNNPFQDANTDINGIAYFPLEKNPPQTFTLGETYNIKVIKEGYNDTNDTSQVSGITRKQIILTKP